MLYHSGLKIFDAGYLGVDMFFVISGFLITGIIARGLRDDRFSFALFYTRRVRRLLPAAYTVLVVTSIASALILTTTQYEAFFVNLVGSVFFSANFALWSQTGYFHPDSVYEPLLHMWSLAIEEQYYLFLPIILTLLPRRTWLPLLAAGSVLSLAACFYLAATRPSVAFYWLPPRAWELGIGSLAALTWEWDHVRRWARALLWPAIAAIALTPVWALPGPTPGLGAVLICLAAGVVILARDERADASPLLRLLARVGDFSYSLYLVHWPLFALIRATRLTDELDPAVSVALILASIGLAMLLYNFIEEPLRRSQLSGRKLVFTALAGSAVVLSLGWALGQAKPGLVRISGQEDPVEGLNISGCFSEDELIFKGKCTQSPTPEVLLWGDSYSSHLVPGLEATSRHPFAQASKGHCSPMVDYAAVATANEYEWSKGCIAYNDSVIDYARRTKSLKVVILAGQYFRTLPEAGVYAIRRQPDGAIVRAELGLEPTIQAQRETVARLRGLGLRVIVVSPPPPSDFDMGKCWERKAEGLPMTGPHRSCIFRTANPARANWRHDEMMAGFERVADVPVIRLETALCHDGRCQIEQDGKPIFRDTGHFTPWGSLLVGRRLDLGERAWRDAR